MTFEAAALTPTDLKSSGAGTVTASPKTIARAAGLLYLAVAVFSTFALIVVDGQVYVPGDATTTAENLVSKAFMVRLAVVADLAQATAFVFLAMVLHVLLRHVNRNIAGAMVVLVAIATAMMCLDAVFRFGGLLVATGVAYEAGFGAAGSDALALLLLDLQHFGFLTAQVFFGLWLVPLGYLVFKSGLFPKTLGIVLIAGGAGYIVDLLLAFLAPEISSQVHGFVVIPATIGEVWTLGYLLAIGVRSQGPGTASSAVASAPVAA